MQKTGLSNDFSIFAVFSLFFLYKLDPPLVKGSNDLQMRKYFNCALFRSFLRRKKMSSLKLEKSGIMVHPSIDSQIRPSKIDLVLSGPRPHVRKTAAYSLFIHIFPHHFILFCFLLLFFASSKWFCLLGCSKQVSIQSSQSKCFLAQFLFLLFKETSLILLKKGKWGQYVQ